MEILTIAIEAEGGISRLAKTLGIRQSAVSNWIWRKKLPRHWDIALSAKYAAYAKKFRARNKLSIEK